jgi:large subunit ribosomal protein L29
MKTKDIRIMNVNELEIKLTELKDKMFKQKIQKSLGQSETSNVVGKTRKDISKILTILTEKKRSEDGK